MGEIVFLGKRSTKLFRNLHSEEKKLEREETRCKRMKLFRTPRLVREIYNLFRLIYENICEFFCVAN